MNGRAVKANWSTVLICTNVALGEAKLINSLSSPPACYLSHDFNYALCVKEFFSLWQITVIFLCGNPLELQFLGPLAIQLYLQSPRQLNLQCFYLRQESFQVAISTFMQLLLFILHSDGVAIQDKTIQQLVSQLAISVVKNSKCCKYMLCVWLAHQKYLSVSEQENYNDLPPTGTCFLDRVQLLTINCNLTLPDLIQSTLQNISKNSQ